MMDKNVTGASRNGYPHSSKFGSVTGRAAPKSRAERYVERKVCLSATVNEVLMHFRKPVVRMERTTEEEDGATLIQIKTATASRMSLVDHISLHETTRQLSPGYRAVFLLHHIAGYEHQEIGEILGCGARTSKSQLHKARMKVRWFQKEDYPRTEERMKRCLLIKKRLIAQRRARAMRAMRIVSRG